MDVERLFRNVMGRFATGITVITTSIDGEVFGMTANAFMAGSLQPQLCVISVGRHARMHERLGASGYFGVSFLSEEQQHLSDHFAGRRVPRFEPEFRFISGTPVVTGALGSVAAEIIDTAECGDHTLFIGRIVELQVEDGRPLLFYGGRYAAIDPVHGMGPGPSFSFW